MIDIAHDICDPLNRRGSLVVYKEQQWILVANTDPLTASMYCYDLPPGVTVSLSKISQRAGKSVTSSAASADENTLANRLKGRDGKCWMSGIIAPLANSHIVPKRMGDDTARSIFQTFTSIPPPPNLTLSDEIFCLSLSLTLDTWFDEYELGFRFVSPNVYECHLFINPDREDSGANEDLDWTIFGAFTKELRVNYPIIHGRRVSPPHP